VARKAMVVEECGGLQAVAVTEKGKAPEFVTNRRPGPEADKESTTNLRFHTKSSFYLGKWIPRPAAIPANLPGARHLLPGGQSVQQCDQPVAQAV
jgi:hypothetical protein